MLRALPMSARDTKKRLRVMAYKCLEDINEAPPMPLEVVAVDDDMGAQLSIVLQAIPSNAMVAEPAPTNPLARFMFSEEEREIVKALLAGLDESPTQINLARHFGKTNGLSDCKPEFRVILNNLVRRGILTTTGAGNEKVYHVSSEFKKSVRTVIPE